MKQTVYYFQTAYTITVEHDEWSIAWQEENVPHKLEIVLLKASPSAKLLNVTFLSTKYLASGEPGGPPERDHYDENNWYHFYHAQVPYAVGHFVATQCMNGLTRRSARFSGSRQRLDGAMFFDALGNIRQPISATLWQRNSPIQNDIEVNVHTGTPPYEFSPLEGIALELTSNGAIYRNVEPGEYTIRITDSKQEKHSQTITIHDLNS